jgi:hypothetical protein
MKKGFDPLLDVQDRRTAYKENSSWMKHGRDTEPS